MKAVVIGSGIAGIATSIRLACKGYQVDVYESNDYPGGKLTAFSDHGFRFDAGPSLFTMPHLVDELFLLAGKDPRSYFNYHKKEIACRYFYEDGTLLTAWGDRKKFAREVENTLGTKADLIESHLKRSEWLYNSTASFFLEKSLHKLGSYLSRETLKAMSGLVSPEFFRNMNSVNTARFKDPKLSQLFNRFATYNGSDPYQAPGIMNVIPHLEHGLGTYLPEGGMHSICTSLFDLAKDLGVSFHFNQKVEKILVKKGQATGIMLFQQEVNADLVVSNMDVAPTYRYLLSDQPAPQRTLKQERSSSALIFYWGIRDEFPQLDLHNIFFSDDYQTEFNHIFRSGSVYHDPTVYVNITSKFISEDAPPGSENWFVMVNVPSDQGQEWDSIIPVVRHNISKKLNRILKTEIETKIETETILDPRLIEKKTSSLGGSLYGTSSNSWLSAFLRHPNFSPRIKGLYFCGGSVHPGGGIPLCLLSARIVDDQIKPASR